MPLGSFRLFRPRHPLARLAVAVLGVIAAVALLTFTLFAIVALVIGGGVFLLVNALRGGSPRGAAATPRTATAPPGVIEGEYTVVQAASTRESLH